MSLTPRARVARRRQDDERGAIAIVVAAFSVVMMGLAAIVVDLGYTRDLQGTAQAAADAAALAAATCMNTPTCGNATAADAAGRTYITANGWDATGASFVYDNANGIVTVSLPSRPSPSFFARAIGATGPAVGGSAKATWKPSATSTCALCVLGDFNGQIGDTTLGGNLLVNGALTFNNAGGTVTITGPGAVGYHGSFNGNGTFKANGTSITPLPFSPAFTDPYAGLALPPGPADGVIGLTTTPAVAGTGTCAPGIYKDLSGCSSLTGNGVYVVVGSGSGMTDVTVDGADVPNTLIYFTCHATSGSTTLYAPCGPTNQNGAQFAGTGNTTITVNGRTTGTYQGFAVIYDRKLVTAPTFAGNGQLNITGSLYGSNLSLDYRGNSKLYVNVQGNVVVRDVTLKGNGANKEHMDVPGNGTPVTVPGGPPPIHLIP